MPALGRLAVRGGDLLLRRSGAHSEHGVGIHPVIVTRAGTVPACGCWPWRIGRSTPTSRSSPHNYDVDAILTLGDLQPSWLETLDKCRLPKLGVYGNHDDEPYMTWFGIDNLHLNRIDLDSGLSFAASRAA